MPIEYLQLNNRIYNALIRYGIGTIEQLQVELARTSTYQHGLEVKGIGVTGRGEIIRKLNQFLIHK